MAVPVDQPVLVVAVLEGQEGAAQLSTVSKRCTQRTCSLRVRMKRSAQPLPSGSRTKAGPELMPRKRSQGRGHAKADPLAITGWAPGCGEAAD